ncbi:hypothetical protein ES703_96756 [subsurface metagenome]
MLVRLQSAGLLLFEKIPQHGRNLIACQVPVCDIVNLDRRREHTASQTRHFLNGKHFLLVRILLLADAKISFKCVIDLPATLDVACCPDTNSNCMTTGRAMSKLAIESRDTGNRCRSNFRQLAGPLKSFFRQIAKVALYSLQNLKHLLPPGADFINGLLYKCQIQLVHHWLIG